MTTSTPPFLPGPNEDDSDLVGGEGAENASSIDADRAAGSGEDIDTDYQPETSSADADREAATED